MSAAGEAKARRARRRAIAHAADSGILRVQRGFTEDA
jgi:hypothetical protein